MQRHHSSIINLELENIKGSQGNRKGREYEPAPSCKLLYDSRTRAKVVSSQPFFNARTERFMRDWSGIATVTVRDSRNREHDPILGVVPLKLSDILETS